MARRNDGPGVGRRNRHAEAALLARKARQAHDQTLVFSSRHFVGFGLPVRRPPSEQRDHIVSNGGGSLTVLAGKHGLPFGQDRLFIVWLASAFFAAGKPKDNVIRFDSVGSILQAFDQGEHDAGTEYRLLRARILRLFGCSFIWKLPAKRDEETGIIHTTRLQRGQLMSELDLSFLKGQGTRGAKWSQRITLDPTWANDLRAGETVPYDLESLKSLRRNPIALDLYLWQAWRSWRLSRKPAGWMRKPIEVPIFGDGGLLAQFGYKFARQRKAKEVLRRAQGQIAGLWEDCPNGIDRNGEKFLVGPGVAVTVTHDYVKLPGVSPAPGWVLEEEQIERSQRPRQVLSLRRPDKPKA